MRCGKELGERQLGVKRRVARPRRLARQHRLGDARPHEGERRQAEEMHVVVRRRAGVVGVLHPVLHQPHRRLLQLAERGLGGREIGRQRRVVLAGGEEGGDVAEEGGDGAAAVLGQLAADEVERLHAVRAFVDHGDARVADELLHAPFGDVAVAAEHLLRLDRVGEALVGEDALDHRRQQADAVVGELARIRRRAKTALRPRRAPPTASAPAPPR